jgi:hypothetical protein
MLSTPSPGRGVTGPDVFARPDFSPRGNFASSFQRQPALPPQFGKIVRHPWGWERAVMA